MPELVTPELVETRRELEAAGAQARAICAGLSEAELGWPPGPDKWSIAECLRHLETTTELFLPGLDRAVARARAQRLVGSGPFRVGLWGRLLVVYVEPPPKLRLPAPKPLRPLLVGPAEQALPRYLASHAVLTAKLAELEGIDLSRATYVSPIASYIRMNLLTFLRVHTGHERRHLWQAERVRRRIPVELLRE